MSTGFVPSSVSTVCVTRQPWAAEVEAFLSWLANERKVSVSTHVRHWRPCCSLRQGAVHGSAPLQEIGRPAVAALAGGADPDEVVRILGFLEGEHRLFAQLLYGTGM